MCLGIQGHNEQNKYNHDLLRLATSLICASGFNHKVSAGFNKYWPGDKRKGNGKISERALEQLRQLRKVEAQKSALEKIKNA